MSTILEASEEKANGTRLARLLIDGGTHALRTVFDSIHPAPTLQATLRSNSRTLQCLKSRRAIFDSQWEALYPPSGDPPDSKTFDITLLHLLLREICYLARPATGWNDLPGDADLSREAHIVRIKYFRNELCHSISTSIRNAEFNDKWNKISSSLTALGFDQNEINRLKNEPIDHLTEDRVKAEVQKWTLDFETQIQGLKQDVKQVKDEMARINQSSSGKTTDGLGSCLPDEVPIFGRSQEIREITGAVQPGQAAVVVITGGPGFGKTTVANKVAHELANQPYRNTVLFCPLKSKTTVFDVATSMILACSTNHFQPPENPQHWLLNWGKQQMENVTFVLDNADDVLQSDERTQFTSILRDMRIFSRQKITFVVTSRRVFKDSSLKMAEVRLTPLSLDESMKIIVSRLPDQSLKKDLCKTKKLVELCGCVPLALCIVGSLLSDYTEEELIKLLEEKPLEVLREDESDDNSVEKAIKTSFDVLSKIEQDALILLSAFPGSFSPEAAKYVITNGTKCSTQAISLLRSLKNRSLVEQPTFNRYQIHPLIQAFLKQMDEDIQIVNQGRRAACSYFISCLDGNANLYWSKDTCKESITLFNKDRHNFEYFIEACIRGLSNNDPDDVAIMETLLKKASPISSIRRYLYLEKILLPTVYMEFLEVSCKLLTSSKQSASKIVMLLCLLGLQSRIAGDLTKYKEYVLKATNVHSQNSLEFDNDKLAEGFFQTNIARFLAEQGKLDEAIEKYHFCLEICKEHSSVDGMPAQKAVTLCFAGAEHNRRDERVKAGEQFNEALDIYAVFCRAKKVKDPSKSSVYDTMKSRFPSRRNKGEPATIPYMYFSDYLPFYMSIGIPSVDFSYFHGHDDQYSLYPVYHTQEDSFYWMETFIDPKFEYHATMTKLVGGLLLDFSEALVLPYDVVRYAKALNASFEFLEKELLNANNDIQTQHVKSAIREFTNASNLFQATKEELNENGSELILRAINDQLVQVEKAFITPYLNVSEPMYKHVYSRNYYGHWFPGVTRAMQNAVKTNEFSEVKIQLSLVEEALLSAADILKPLICK